LLTLAISVPLPAAEIAESCTVVLVLAGERLLAEN